MGNAGSYGARRNLYRHAMFLGFSIADFYSRDNDGFCSCANSVNQAELVIFFSCI